MVAILVYINLFKNYIKIIIYSKVKHMLIIL